MSLDAPTYSLVAKIQQGYSEPALNSIRPTPAPVAGKDLVCLGGSFIRTSYPAVQAGYPSPLGGQTWTARATWSSSGNMLIESNGSTTLAVSYSTGGQYVKRSTNDGVSFTTITSGVANTYFHDIEFGNGIWIVCGYSDIMRSTDDGVTWSSIYSAFSGISAGTSRVTYVSGSTWVIVYKTGSSGLMTMRSTDGGATWGSTQTLTASSFIVNGIESYNIQTRGRCIAYDGTKIMLAIFATSQYYDSYNGEYYDTNATIFVKSTDGTSWTTVGPYNALTFTDTTVLRYGAYPQAGVYWSYNGNLYGIYATTTSTVSNVYDLTLSFGGNTPGAFIMRNREAFSNNTSTVYRMNLDAVKPGYVGNAGASLASVADIKDFTNTANGILGVTATGVYYTDYSAINSMFQVPNVGGLATASITGQPAVLYYLRAA